MRRYIEKIQAVYPDRTKKLSFLSYIKLTLIDFGWVVVIFLGYMATKIHWSGPQLIFSNDIMVFTVVGVGLFVNFFALELLMGFLVKLRLRLDARKQK
jgi:hypothetical protein